MIPCFRETCWRSWRDRGSAFNLGVTDSAAGSIDFIDIDDFVESRGTDSPNNVHYSSGLVASLLNWVERTYFFNWVERGYYYIRSRRCTIMSV